MSFIPNQASAEEIRMKGTQMKPAFWIHSGWPSTTGCGSPPMAPNTPAVMTIGTTNCITETPALPRPAFSASALPFCRLGKKKLILAMDEAKLPPPKPHSRASTRKMK